MIADVDGTYSKYLKVVGTTDDGGPLVAALDGNVVLHVANLVPDSYGTGAVSATGDYENDGFVQQDAATLGRPAHLYIGDLAADYDDEFEQWHRYVVRDDAGRPATWASLLFDDEGGVRTVGAVQEPDGTWRAHLWEVHPDDGRWRVEERGDGPLLATAPDAATLVTSTEEVWVMLAETTDQGVRLWGINADPYHPERWRRVGLPGGADSVTDILSWAIGGWVAGTRDGRAVIWDLSSEEGEVDIPRIDLDPDHPVVRLLRLPIASQPAFAVQAPDGPSVWVKGTGGWRELKAPEGTMTLAAASETGVYLIIDGRLWFRSLQWDEELP